MKEGAEKKGENEESEMRTEVQGQGHARKKRKGRFGNLMKKKRKRDQKRK